jgi:hypothetical protein
MLYNIIVAHLRAIPNGDCVLHSIGSTEESRPRLQGGNIDLRSGAVTCKFIQKYPSMTDSCPRLDSPYLGRVPWASTFMHHDSKNNVLESSRLSIVLR